MASTFKRVRIAVLLAVLAGVVAWGGQATLRRRARLAWRRTLAIDVVLVTRGAVAGNTIEQLRERLPALGRFFDAEIARHRGPSPRPFHFRLRGPLPLPSPVPVGPPLSDGLVARAHYTWGLWRWRRPIDAKVPAEGSDVRIYFVLSPPLVGAARFAEGVGAKGGDYGMVQTALDENTVDLGLIALGHEVLHTVGATDKYDEEGHALVPDGLCAPAAGYPQPCAEIMVGERAVSPGRGEVASRLTDVRVGHRTAVEIGWTKERVSAR